jgi:hypothetical protein
LNQCIVLALDRALERETTAGREEAILEEVRSIRGALSDLAIPWDPDRLPQPFRPLEGLPDSDTVRQSSLALVAPLSATIVADRTDRL